MTPPTTTAVGNDGARDAGRCPVCGGPNLCAMAAGWLDEACWCTQVEFSPGALADVPPEERGGRCVCPRCAVRP